MLKVEQDSNAYDGDITFTAVIERPDGTTYYQQCPDALLLLDWIGDDYWIVDIF